MSSTEDKPNSRKLRSQIYSKVRNGREALRIEPLDSDTDEEHTSSVRGRIKANSQHATQQSQSRQTRGAAKSQHVVVTSAPVPKLNALSVSTAEKSAYTQDVMDETDDAGNESNSSIETTHLASSSPNDSPSYERKAAAAAAAPSDEFILPRGMSPC